MLRRISPDLIAPDTATLLGAPGAGKGTLVKNLSVSLRGRMNIVPVGTGDMLRAERARGTELGQKVGVLMDLGELVPDELMFPVVRARVEQFANERNAAMRALLSFDGFPRTTAQAHAHSQYLDEFDLRNLTVHLKVPVDRFDELAQRIAKRAMEDQAAGRPVRSDDLDPETVARRLQIAQTKLWPVVDHAGERGELVEVDAMGTPEEICDTVQPLVAPDVEQPQRLGGSVDCDMRPFMVRLSPQ